MRVLFKIQANVLFIIVETSSIIIDIISRVLAYFLLVLIRFVYKSTAPLGIAKKNISKSNTRNVDKIGFV